MKPLGPLNGSGPRSETKSRVAQQRSSSRSDAGRASPTSLSPSKPTASTTLTDRIQQARAVRVEDETARRGIKLNLAAEVAALAERGRP